MGLAFWRRKVVVGQYIDLENLQNRVHRLEIAHTQALELIDANNRLVARLLKRMDGDKGGRPSGVAQLRGLPPIVPGQPYPHHGA